MLPPSLAGVFILVFRKTSRVLAAHYRGFINTLASHSSFVGRRALLADVREHLRSSRVVTLMGHGGVGKTRVALRVAEESRGTFRDGCWVVPLEDLGHARAGVPRRRGGPRACMAPTGRGRSRRSPTTSAHRDALLVLDNCEHLLSPVSDLVEELRAACPHVGFLLTSRRPLRLSGEDVVVVPPLDLPDEADFGATPEVISHYEAVRLFVDRATSARSDFELTPDNAPAVAVLCRDLQGVPLAIEWRQPGSGCCHPRRSARASGNASTSSTWDTAMPAPGKVAERLRRVVLPSCARTLEKGLGTLLGVRRRLRPEGP